MLNHPTLDLMHSLGLDGMAKGFKDLQNDPESQALDHQEWLGSLKARQVRRSNEA